MQIRRLTEPPEIHRVRDNGKDWLQPAATKRAGVLDTECAGRGFFFVGHVQNCVRNIFEVA
jgi:hypothetical protein